VRDAAVVVEHHPLHLVGYDCDLRVRAGELADRVQRTPARDDQELDAALDRPAQDGGVDEACNTLQLGKGVAAQVRDVVVGALRAREAAPLPGDQIGS